ncbi:hypothetical protein OIU84_015509, partial [Salix udensis]
MKLATALTTVLGQGLCVNLVSPCMTWAGAIAFGAHLSFAAVFFPWLDGFFLAFWRARSADRASYSSGTVFLGLPCGVSSPAFP